jgi:hypothetical protein
MYDYCFSNVGIDLALMYKQRGNDDARFENVYQW